MKTVSGLDAIKILVNGGILRDICFGKYPSQYEYKLRCGELIEISHNGYESSCDLSFTELYQRNFIKPTTLQDLLDKFSTTLDHPMTFEINTYNQLLVTQTDIYNRKCCKALSFFKDACYTIKTVQGDGYSFVYPIGFLDALSKFYLDSGENFNNTK